MAGYVFLGITYGLLMVRAGFPAWLPIVTALLIYTGSLEFLLVQILQSPVNLLSTFVTAIMVGARHIFYGISMLTRYRGRGWKTPYLIFSTSDETFAVNYSAKIPDGIDEGWFYWWVSLLDQMFWVVGSALGALFGSLITFDTTGLEFVMTTMFAVIFFEQWRKDSEAAGGEGLGLAHALRCHAAELIGLGCSLLCLLVFGPDSFIVPSMICMLVLLLVFRKRISVWMPSGEKPSTVEMGGDEQ
ncbi:MAG: AzlC family ABC transporter permease [Tractidigestivibacter sp.]|jgi:4-azaleucine resistance transporter AzlC|uniref:AzlC family ABC transporter permease n=1 Tax=Tractidigestivibacter sp. TaxID=2847320 RepID=UPI003D8DA6B0